MASIFHLRQLEFLYWVDSVVSAKKRAAHPVTAKKVFYGF